MNPDLAAILDEVDRGVVVIDAEARIACCNRAAELLLGWSRNDMLGRDIHRLVHGRLPSGEPYARKDCPILRTLQDGVKRQLHYETLVCRNGSLLPVSLTATAMRREGRIDGAVVVFQDIGAQDAPARRLTDVTELKNAQAQLEKLNEVLLVRTREAEAANRAKGTFLSVMSHELRTPLHTILGYTGILRREASATAKEMLATIDASGRQLLRLIDDILDFSQSKERKISLQPAYFSLSALAGRVNDSARILAARRNNRFELELDFPASVQVETDEQRLLQVLQNLIDNACKFTTNGVVRLAIAQAEDGPAADDTHRRFLFSVEDTGTGIPAAQQTTIFEPFVRGPDKEHVPGIGLGLAIAKQLVEAMGGTLGLDSAEGKGSRFRFALSCPVQIGACDPVVTRVEGPIVGYEGRQRTLVVADDVPTNRFYIECLCAFWGFRVIPAANGMEAVKACVETRPAPDAALIDQFMPVFDGWDCLRAIRNSQATAGMPVVLISAAAMTTPDDFPAAMRFDAYLRKPVMQDDLAQTLADLLHLKWMREAEAESTPAAPVDGPSAPALSPAEWDEFAAMVGMGRILALQQWAAALADARPELQAFVEQVKDLCKRVDLAGLERILAKRCT